MKTISFYFICAMGWAIALTLSPRANAVPAGNLSLGKALGTGRTLQLSSPPKISFPTVIDVNEGDIHLLNSSYINSRPAPNEGEGDNPLTSIIAAWDFFGTPSAPAVHTATVFDGNLNSSNLITRGPGAPGSSGANSFRTTGFGNDGISVSNTDYFEVTLGAAPGYMVSLSTINARFGGTSTYYASPGVTSRFAYSLDNSSFTFIGTEITSTSLTMPQIDLSTVPELQNVPSGTTIILRYYASGQTSSGGWGFYSPASGSYGLSLGGSVALTAGSPSITIAASGNNICAGTQVSFTAISSAGGPNPVYQWRINGSQVGGNSPSYIYIPSNNDFVDCVLTSGSGTTNTVVATSNVLTMTVIPLALAGVTIASSATDICQGSTVTLTASPVNGGDTPLFQWFVNNASAGTNTSVLTYTPTDQDAIYCVMTSDMACVTCNPAVSNILTLSVTPPTPVSLTILVSSTSVCQGNGATFTAVATNAGDAPAYQWNVNGTNAGNGGQVFTYTPSDGDIVTCMVTSSLICSTGNPATSSPVIMSVTAPLPVSISISASANPVNSGTQVTFSATPVNAGLVPSFQWKINGINSGMNIPTFSYVPVNNDVVTCLLTSGAACSSATPSISNEIVMTVNCIAPASVSVNGVIGSGADSTYLASEEILVAGGTDSFIVMNGGRAMMNAGTTIRYLPGTRVESGGYMSGDIIPSMSGCGSLPPSLVTVRSGNDVSVARSGSYTVFPNPASDHFTLEVQSDEVPQIVSVELWGLQGVRLITAELNGARSRKFDVTELPSGLYMLRISDGHNIESIKIIKQN